MQNIGLCKRSNGAKCAAALAKTTTIRHLNVGANKIKDKGAMALSKNSTITNLNVAGNEIGDKGKSALAEKDPYKRAKNALDAGIPPTDVPIPSLKRLTLFAVQNNPNLRQQAQASVSDDLKEELLKPKL